MNNSFTKGGMKRIEKIIREQSKSIISNHSRNYVFLLLTWGLNKLLDLGATSRGHAEGIRPHGSVSLFTPPTVGSACLNTNREKGCSLPFSFSSSTFESKSCVLAKDSHSTPRSLYSVRVKPKFVRLD